MFLFEAACERYTSLHEQLCGGPGFRGAAFGRLGLRRTGSELRRVLRAVVGQERLLSIPSARAHDVRRADGTSRQGSRENHTFGFDPLDITDLTVPA